MNAEKYRKALREMYELGLEHGRELAKKDMEIERLKASLSKDKGEK